MESKNKKQKKNTVEKNVERKRVFFFWCQWQYEKVEAFLAKMEENGYRLERISFLYFFTFVKKPPARVRYVFYYTLLKDYDMFDYDSENYLKTECRGAQICKRNFEPYVYRITNTDADLSFIINNRTLNVKKAYFQKLMAGILFLAFFIFATVMQPSSALLTVDVLAFLWVAFHVWGLIAIEKVLKSSGTRPGDNCD